MCLFRAPMSVVIQYLPGASVSQPYSTGLRRAVYGGNWWSLLPSCVHFMDWTQWSRRMFWSIVASGFPSKKKSPLSSFKVRKLYCPNFVLFFHHFIIAKMILTWWGKFHNFSIWNMMTKTYESIQIVFLSPLNLHYWPASVHC